MQKRNILFLFICFLSLCSSVFSQDKPVAVKIAEYDETTETIETFVEKTNFFLKKLSESPKSTTGLIAIPTEDFPSYKSLFEQAETILFKNAVLKDRIELLKPVPPGFRPKSLPEKTEFWLIPLNADKPYSIEVLCGLVLCPTIEIEGYDFISDKNESHTFTANVSGGGGGNITFHWTVSAGKIASGQESPVITIDFSEVKVEEITIAIELGGFDKFCQTKVERKVKIVKQK